MQNSDIEIFKALIKELSELTAQKPSNNDELHAIQCFSRNLEAQINSLSFDDCPSEIRHYLSDADIRFRDKRYDQLQTPKYLAAIDSWKRKHISPNSE